MSENCESEDVPESDEYQRLKTAIDNELGNEKFITQQLRLIHDGGLQAAIIQSELQEEIAQARAVSEQEGPILEPDNIEWTVLPPEPGNSNRAADAWPETDAATAAGQGGGAASEATATDAGGPGRGVSPSARPAATGAVPWPLPRRPTEKPPTATWRRTVLAALRLCPNVELAAQTAGVNVTTVYDHRRADPLFAEAVAAAHAAGVALLHAEVFRRAVEGVTRPIYQGGALVGYERVYSDRLAELLLKGHMPEMFDRDTKMKARASDLPQATPEEVLAIVARLRLPAPATAAPPAAAAASEPGA